MTEPTHIETVGHHIKRPNNRYIALGPKEEVPEQVKLANTPRYHSEVEELLTKVQTHQVKIAGVRPFDASTYTDKATVYALVDREIAAEEATLARKDAEHDLIQFTADLGQLQAEGAGDERLRVEVSIALISGLAVVLTGILLLMPVHEVVVGPYLTKGLAIAGTHIGAGVSAVVSLVIASMLYLPFTLTILRAKERISVLFKLGYVLFVEAAFSVVFAILRLPSSHDITPGFLAWAGLEMVGALAFTLAVTRLQNPLLSCRQAEKRLEKATAKKAALTQKVTNAKEREKEAAAALRAQQQVLQAKEEEHFFAPIEQELVESSTRSTYRHELIALINRRSSDHSHAARNPQ